jgi:zinc protease
VNWRIKTKDAAVVPGEVNQNNNVSRLKTPNGAKVTTKIPFQNDEVFWWVLGGSNLYSNEEMKSQFANGALAEAGFSGLNRTISINSWQVK